MNSSDPITVDETLASTLDVLDDAVNYRRWIVDLARPYLIRRPPSHDPDVGRILEIGAGHGTFTSEFARIAPVHAIEPSQYAAGVLAHRFEADSRVAVTRCTINDLPTDATYDSAVMINVLEHIDDDRGALDEIHRRLQPGGCVVIWVPAFMALYSQFDRELGHHRRYRRPALDALVRSAGFEILRSHYVNSPGWLSWLLITRLLRQRPTSGPLVKVFDRFVVPVVRAIEFRFSPPFGQSIFVVGRKPATEA